MVADPLHELGGGGRPKAHAELVDGDGVSASRNAVATEVSRRTGSAVEDGDTRPVDVEVDEIVRVGDRGHCGCLPSGCRGAAACRHDERVGSALGAVQRIISVVVADSDHEPEEERRLMSVTGPDENRHAWSMVQGGARL